jgi:large repetitive protein
METIYNRWLWNKDGRFIDISILNINNNKCEGGYYTSIRIKSFVLFVYFVLLGTLAAYAQANFSAAGLQGTGLNNPTSLEFGPDGRLYVSQQNGTIKVFTITRNSAADYRVTATETIDLVKNIPNHDDNGRLNTSVNTRQVTGILVRGTRDNPVLYVTSSDPRIGGGGSGASKNLDTNSGILSKLTKTAAGWDKTDLVRGLPRSEENHASNGIQIDERTNTLYIAQGGNTNAGAPSNNFAFHTEYALAAAILSVDLTAIEAMPTRGSGNTKYKYDLPTLDDPTRDNNDDGTDVGDPWGGNKGLNQAKIVQGGPVQVYAPGFRNPYDLVITKTPGKEGRIYSWDNGANSGWGGFPEGEGAPTGNPAVSRATNNYVQGEPGSNSLAPNGKRVTNRDGLHFVDRKGYYAGHPTPIRANPTGAGLYVRFGTEQKWLTRPEELPRDWPPVPANMANPIEGHYLEPGPENGALMYRTSKSINGIAEYTASNFNGSLKGNLIAASYNDRVLIMVELNDAGDKVVKEWNLASNFGSLPLDVTTQGDNDIFPGTIWAATYGTNEITVFEPQDGSGECGALYSWDIDDDGDGYSNADEIDNGTDPCSAASVPADFDKDFLSDLNDPDDDGDGILDINDAFQWDKDNGKATQMPIQYTMLNGDPGFGFFGQGFTGLMINGRTDYLEMFDSENLITGGAVGLFTIKEVPAGDAYEGANTQQNAFQFGIDVSAASGPFTAKTRMLGPYFNEAPRNNQSQGFYIGTGHQDHYLKLVLNANGGQGGFQVIFESEGRVVLNQQYPAPGYRNASYIDLFLAVDPATGTVQAKYLMEGGEITNLGNPIQLRGNVLAAVQGEPAMAVGLISTSAGSGSPFLATWDHIHVTPDQVSTGNGQWITLEPSDNSKPEKRHEHAYVQAGDKFYLLGGRGIKPVEVYDPSTRVWTKAARTPVEMHHFQAVEYKGLIYVIGAFTGRYPNETPLEHIYIYDPVADTWMQGPQIPASRRRGSAGVVVHNDKMYVVSGITNGHTSGHVTWVDEFDPATNTWRQLANAPRARDHFHAAVVNGKLYAASGRRSSFPDTWGPVVGEVDVYDFSANTWTTLAEELPTKRAGAATAVLGNNLIIIGGESMSQTDAHHQTEALDTESNTWSTLANMNTGRHGTQAIVSNRGIYVASGSKVRGNSEIDSQEAFYFGNPTQPTGTALAKGNLVAPDSLYAGADAGTVMLHISNEQGNQAILITSFTITGSEEFTIQAPYELPVLLAPGSALEVPVTFAASSEGMHTGNLAINHSGGNPAIMVTLVGGKREQEESPVATLVASVENLHFFNQAAQTTSEPQEFRLSNSGSLPLQVTEIRATGANAAEFLHDFNGTLTLEPGASVLVKVRFRPAALGTKVASLEIRHTGNNTTLVIGLTGEASGAPTLSNEIRINAGGERFETSTGVVFEADTYFDANTEVFTNFETTITGTTERLLYNSVREAKIEEGTFTYNIPVPNGSYEISLHFAEIWFGATGGVPNSGYAGSRVFSVKAEGAPLLNNFDIISTVGTMAAVVRKYNIDINDGVLNLEFTASAHKPLISAIEIVPRLTTALPGLSQGSEGLKSYPNPFNGRVTLEYNALEDDEVTLEVYDLTGKRIALLYQGQVKAGTQLQEEFDGSSLKNGMYLGRIKTRHGVLNTKMLLAR